MERFRQAVDSMRDFIGIQPGILFVISYISLSAPGSSCNTDDLRRRISILECYLVMTIVCSAVFTQYVRMVVETDAHSRALRTCRHTNEKVVKEEPKHGISCIAGWEGKVVRPCFCLAIACSYGFSVCAIFALDLSLKLFGCVSGSPEIIPFAVVGVPFFLIGVIATLVHGFLGWVAITQD